MNEDLDRKECPNFKGDFTIQTTNRVVQGSDHHCVVSHNLIRLLSDIIHLQIMNSSDPFPGFGTLTLQVNFLWYYVTVYELEGPFSGFRNT